MSLSPFSTFYLHTLARRLAAQQRAAWLEGRRSLLEEYLQLSPELRRQRAILLGLVCDEILLRESAGETINVEEYARRFPELADLLQAELRERTELQGNHSASEQTFGTAPSFSASAVTVDHESPLPELPGYELIQELGRGGMGIVYLARQKGLNRLVALKMIRNLEYTTGEERLRFEREALAIARLRHDYIVEIYEIRLHEGRPFFSLGHVPGGGLDRRLAGNPQQPRDAAQLVYKLAQGIHAAHQAGIVHRDLKPANVLLEESAETPLGECRPRITDFGLARAVGEPGHTESGAVMGTPSYMAPEQAGGYSRDVGPLADVWSLGAILYEMLTGRPPFKAPTVLDTVKLVLESEPVSLRQLQPGTPGDLETICVKCLQKDPAQRYASAAELAEDLVRWLTGEAIRARPISVMERTWRWCRRNAILASALGAVSLALLMGSVIALVFAWSAEEARKNTEGALQQVEREKQENQRQLLRAETARHAFQINAALRAWEQGDVRRAERLLDELSPDFAGTWEERHLRSLCTRRARSIRAHAKGVVALAYNPTGSQLATSGEDEGVRLWNASTGNEEGRFKEGGPTTALAWSKDGRWIATGTRDGQATLRKAKDSFPVVDALPRLEGRISSVAFDPASRLLAIGCQDGLVRIWDVEQRKWSRELKGHSGPVLSVMFSPDGAQIASGDDDGNVKVWEIAKGRERYTLRGHAGAVTSVAYRPDGKRLASGGDDWSVVVWDLDTGQLAATLDGHNAPISVVAFNPSGKELLSAGEDGLLKVWDATTGAEQMTHRGHVEPIRCAAWRSDDHIATGDKAGTMRLWNLSGRQESRILRPGVKWVQAVAVRSDGKQIAVGTTDNAVTLWNAAGEWVNSLRGQMQGCWSLAYSTDSKYLVAGSSDDWVGVWDLAANKMQFRSSEQRRSVNAVAFSPDGKRIATGSGGRLELWNHATDNRQFSIAAHADWLRSVAFFPDGRTIVTASGPPNEAGEIRFWNADDGKPGLTLREHTGPVWSVAYSPDGRQLVSASGDGTLKIWDVATGEVRFTLRGHEDEVLTVSWLPDGRRIVSGSKDRTLKLWDVKTGQEVLTMRGHQWWVNAVTCSRDGKRLISGAGDGTVRVWGD